MGTKAIGGANGKHGRVFIGALEICVTDWELTEIAQEEDVTNSCSGGKREYEYGIRHCEGSMTMDMDLSQHPLDNPPNLNAGQKVGSTAAPVKLYEHVTTGTPSASAGPRWEFESMGITSVNVSVPAAGRVTYKINWKSSGTYRNPSENSGSSV